MEQVLVAGHVNWDVTLLVDRLPGSDEQALIREQHRAGGGSAANVAAALANLDVESGVLGAVGDDEPGRKSRADLADRGVALDGLETVPGATSVTYLLVAEGADGTDGTREATHSAPAADAGEVERGDVAVLGNEGVNEAIGPDDVDADRFDDVAHLHLTGQRPDIAARLARLAEEAGASISLDPGRRADERDFGPVVDRADLLFGTDREVAALLSCAPAAIPEAAADVEATVIATSGAGGATLYDGEKRHHPGFDVEVRDTSGAGDAFVAGFLASWLADDRDHQEALARGNAAGALASRSLGARSDFEVAEIDALLDRRKRAEQRE